MTASWVNVIEFRHVVDLLDHMASPPIVNRALSADGLSRKVLREHVGFLPYRLEMTLLENVARAIGDQQVGATVATQFNYGAYNAYAGYVLGAEDLRSALSRGQKAFPFIQPGSTITMCKRGPYTLIGRRCESWRNVIGRRHVDVGTIFVLIQLVQHYLGPDWRPAWVEINDEDSSRNGQLEDILGVPVLLGHQTPAIAVETEELYTPNLWPVEAGEAICFSDLPALMETLPPTNMASNVRQALAAKLVLGEGSEDAVAEFLSMGRRTMQRALQVEGTTFREIRASCVESRARSLLSESSIDVATIALSLGYKEPKSFQRAFREWTGITPHVYRSRIRN